MFSNINSMDKKPYHHLPDNTFRNPEGSPIRGDNIKFSYSTFNKEKKKLDISVPEDHVLEKEDVLESLISKQDGDYIGWIGHATFLIKLGKTTIITDPVFSKNAGPLIFGPKRYVEPALNLNEIPKIDLFLLTHNHYDHQDMGTIRKFPYKDAKVIVPLKLGKYFTKNNYKNVNEIDWNDEIIGVHYVDEFADDTTHYIKENNLSIETIEKIIEIFKQKTKNFDERIWDRLEIILNEWDERILED